MAPLLQKLRSFFPMKVGIEKVGKKRVYWSDIQILSADDSIANEYKKRKIDDKVSSPSSSDMKYWTIDFNIFIDFSSDLVLGCQFKKDCFCM